MTISIIITAIILIYGILIGSFLNVCIYRIPQGESVIQNRSHCMGCGANLRSRDLIPVFSYIILKGKCRNCGESISMQYPLIEFLNGMIYVFIFLIRGLPGVAERSLSYHMTSVLFCLVASALVVLSVIDFRTNNNCINNICLLKNKFISVSGRADKGWTGLPQLGTILYWLFLC